MTMQLTGIHHVSTISKDIQASHDFFTGVLGLRLLITTVNQDDPSMFHLFFGDGVGSPGSDLTVFDIPMAAPDRRGNNSISLTTLRVAGDDTLAYWAERLRAHGVDHAGIASRDGRAVLDFADPVGTRLSLVDDGGSGEAHPWPDSPVPERHQIRGLGYTVITVPTLERTERFLTEALGLRHDHTYPLADAPQYLTHVYAIGAGGPSAEVHVIVRDDLAPSRPGSGGVHHVALRVPAGQSIAEWVARLDGHGYRNSGVIDRHYFVSGYVREPNHVLFELATDGPGFEVDGPIDGTRVSLPPFLEPRRAEIERHLRPLRLTDVREHTGAVAHLGQAPG